MNDEDAIKDIRAGSAPTVNALIMKYKGLVHAKAGAYFIAGSDKDDIIQEGMIGLFKSIRDFNPAKGIPFRVFAEICINRQLISAVKAGARHKHAPLNSSLSLGLPLPSHGWGADPEQMLIGLENRLYIKKYLHERLSAMELRILNLHLFGLSYAEIAKSVNRDVKSIDNALQRVRRKADRFLKGKKEN